MLALFVLGNLGIFVGYVYAAVSVMPRMRVKLRRTRIGGVLFFATCGITHFELALHASLSHGFTLAELTSWPMVILHLVQAVAVWMFLTGIYSELVAGTVHEVTFKKKGVGDGY